MNQLLYDSFQIIIRTFRSMNQIIVDTTSTSSSSIIVKNEDNYHLKWMTEGQYENVGARQSKYKKTSTFFFLKI